MKEKNSAPLFEPILIVDDDHMQRHMLATLLRRKTEFTSCEAENGREALNTLEQDTQARIKLVILDLTMPVMGGMETLEIIRQTHPNLPVIMLTGNKDTDKATQAMKLGATDFITKPYEGERMAVTVKNALKLSMLSREVSRLKHESTGQLTFSDLIGHDGGLAPFVHIGRKAAASDIPVLLTGETGTGKEVFSQAIHGESPRKGKPFIAVNCGALPSQLIESTLFGHEKGAFTGAVEKTAGKFREAEGGTIFLDEIGEMPLDAQVKLLRVLQQKEVEPVGAGKAIPVNVRIISATNKDLQKEVDAGRFREDLFFRLNVLQINLPPLRERQEDIAALTQHFIERFCADANTGPKTISKQALNLLTAHQWQGNVRQLENVISRAIVIADENTLSPTHFSALLNAENKTPNLSSNVQNKGNVIQVLNTDGQFKTIEEIEKEAMTLALQHTSGNVTQAAKSIGMAKSTFYRKMGTYGICI